MNNAVRQYDNAGNSLTILFSVSYLLFTRPSQGRNRGSNPRIATNPAFPDFHDSGQYGPRLLRSFESFALGLWIDGRKCHAIPYGRVGASLATQKLPRA